MRRRRRWKQKQVPPTGEFSSDFNSPRLCAVLSSLTNYIILSCSVSVMRRRKGPFKHLKFGTNIDLSDEKK